MSPTNTISVEPASTLPASLETPIRLSVITESGRAITEENLEQQHPPPMANATSAIQPVPMSKDTYLRLASSTFCFLIAGLNDGSLGALIPYILPAYSISTGSIAILYGVSFSAWLSVAICSPILSAYFSSASLLLLGAAFQLLAYSLRAWTPPFWVFAVSFFAASTGQAFQDGQANTYVSTVNKAHKWLAIIHGAYAAGCLIGPLLATSIAINEPTRWALFYSVPLGLDGINIGLVIWSFWSDFGWSKREDSASEEMKLRTAVRETREMLKEKTVWLLSLFYFFYLGAAISAGSWLVQYLAEAKGENLAKAGYVPIGFNGGSALGRLALAEPTQRFGEKRMIFLYCVLCLASEIVFWRVDGLIVNAIFASLIGFCLGPLFATGVSVATKLLPTHMHSSGLALIFVIAQAGGAIFPALTGLIATRAGVQALQPILVALICLTAMSWLVVPEVGKKTA